MSLVPAFGMREDRPTLVVELPDSEPDLARIAVHGDLDAPSSGQVQQAVVEILRTRRPRRIDLDAHGVTFIDSAGIRVLVLCQIDAQQMGCEITVTRAPRTVHRVFEVCGLLSHFHMPQWTADS
jgi:anti-anti-sigma factor